MGLRRLDPRTALQGGRPDKTGPTELRIRRGARGKGRVGLPRLGPPELGGGGGAICAKSRGNTAKAKTATICRHHANRTARRSNWRVRTKKATRFLHPPPPVLPQTLRPCHPWRHRPQRPPRPPCQRRPFLAAPAAVPTKWPAGGRPMGAGPPPGRAPCGRGSHSGIRRRLIAAYDPLPDAVRDTGVHGWEKHTRPIHGHSLQQQVEDRALQGGAGELSASPHPNWHPVSKDFRGRAPQLRVVIRGQRHGRGVAPNAYRSDPLRHRRAQYAGGRRRDIRVRRPWAPYPDADAPRRAPFH